jgi:DNA-binding Lrp family transcriptional regulator
MRAYVLIETAVGTAGFVAAEVNRLNYDDVRLISSDAVTGPFDVIVLLESPNLDTLARFVSEQIQSTNGVQRTTTCIA